MAEKLKKLELDSPVTVNGVEYKGKVEVIEDIAEGIKIATIKKTKANGSKKTKATKKERSK